jgi:diguanylate cyclase (GGDEF)-like protein
MEIRELLRNAELFASLKDDDLFFIMQRTEVAEFKKGQVVFNKGSAAIHFYIIRSGEVVIRQVSDNTDGRELAHYIEGDSFGEFGFITGELHDVEAVALSDSAILLFPAFPHTLDSLSLERPKTMWRLFLRSVEILSKRFQSIQTSISESSNWVKQLQDQMYIDHLTGLYKKMYLESEIPRLLKPPAAVIVVKPDRFKDLNAIYGHQAGDAVLSRIGTLLLDTLRSGKKGFGIRLQSNEMALILQDATSEYALSTARFIAKSIRGIGPSLAMNGDDQTKGALSGKDLRLTSSISVGFYTDKKQSFSGVVTEVYRSMFQLWKDGGNKISMLKGKYDGSQ